MREVSRPPRPAHELARLHAARPAEASERLARALSLHGGSVAHTARALGVTVVTVHRWVLRWGVRGWLETTWPARGRRGRRAAQSGRVEVVGDDTG